MANSKNPFSRIRLVYRRSSPLLKCVVLATIVLCTATIITLNATIRGYQTRVDALRAQAAELQWSNAQLQEYISELGTVKSIVRIAGEELGLVPPDTKFFVPENNSD